MQRLIFEPILRGHHLEYLHHIYSGAAADPNHKYLFAVPQEEWSDKKDKWDWPTADNIKWLMLDDKKCVEIDNGSMISRCFKTSRFIKQLCSEYSIDEIILIDLAPTIPILPIILPSRIKLSGIIYRMYLRQQNSKIKKFVDHLRYTIMAKSRSMNKIFILNDPRSCSKLNKIYHTSRFQTLVDPVSLVDYTKFDDIRTEYNLSKTLTIFLHFGAMDQRKGTLEILKALCIMSTSEYEDKAFIFAGKIASDIKDDFYTLVENARNKGANIFIRDEFCSYSYINSLCNTADCILIPYLLTGLSSGALGYAAAYKTPVIGPSTGLIGELIADNHLGINLPAITPSALRDAIVRFRPYDLTTNYAERNTITHFVETILS